MYYPKNHTLGLLWAQSFPNNEMLVPLCPQPLNGLPQNQEIRFFQRRYQILLAPRHEFWWCLLPPFWRCVFVFDLISPKKEDDLFHFLKTDLLPSCESKQNENAPCTQTCSWTLSCCQTLPSTSNADWLNTVPNLLYC